MMDRESKYEYYGQLAIAYKNAAKLLKCFAAIHVEASDDKNFWEKVFNTVLPEKCFHFITYTRTKEGNKATGCSVCLNYRDFLSKDFFICIDSDYRYLLQEKNINVTHAIFQTYTYSIENHYCYSVKINDVFKAMGLVNNLFDFEYFLKEYSKCLYKLFIYHLHSLSLKDGIFTKEDFKYYLNIDRPSLLIEKLINHLQLRADNKLKELEIIYIDLNIKKLITKYKKLGLNEDNAYLYFRGHNLFERVILPIAREIRKKLEAKLVEPLSGPKKKEFFEENKDLRTYFMNRVYIGEYPEINKITEDINHFFN